MQVSEAKAAAYPNSLKITESKCEVSLQDLLDHTVKRLCTYLNLDFDQDFNERLVLIVKYRFDGTNINNYKQKSEDKSAAHDHMFWCSIVPVQLIDEVTDKCYWKNPRPSETRLCRPVTILYQKETTELIESQEANMKQQIEELEDIQFGGYSVEYFLN